ncbi:MAG: hypothetical protein WCW52_04150 [Elusimicrobiales bacterium]
MTCAAWAAAVPFRARPADAGLPGEWLTAFSAGVRDAGLANASTALTGAAAPYANPAGIAANTAGEVVLMVAPLIASGQYQALSVSYPLSVYDSMGFSLLRLGSGSAERTDALGGSAGSFEEQDYAFLLSYAQHLSNNLAAGVTVKAVRQSMAEFSDTGFGIDLGLQAKPSPDLTLGLSVLNLLPPRVKLMEKTEVFPVSYRAGAAYSLSAHRTFLLCPDVVISLPPGGRRVIRPGFGLELQPLSDEAPFLVRLGADRKEYTLGFSVRAGPVSFDYAVAFHELETLHRFGLTMRYDVLPLFAEKKKKAEVLKDLKQEARAWLKAGNYAECEKTIQRILELNGSDPDAPILAVEIQRSQAAAQIAQRAAEKKAQAEAKQAEAAAQAQTRLTEAKGLYLAKKYRKALETLNDSLPMLRDNLLAQSIATMCKAHLFMEKGDYTEAMKLLGKAVEMDPDNREAAMLYKRVQDITGTD